MDSKNLKQLEEAKAYFYAWRLVEAYNVFRRFFDRLPFKPEKAHAEYIGMFVRTLVELGKDFELKFYMAELERLQERLHSPEIAYSLAVVYRYQSPPKWEASHKLFEQIARNPQAPELHAKAKMMLADYYSNKGDIAACRVIIDSIETADPQLQKLVLIWKGYICYVEKKFDQGIGLMRDLLMTSDPKNDWYTHFSAAPVLALLYLDKGDIPSAKAVLEEIRALFEGRQFKSVRLQLKELEERLQKEESLGSVLFTKGIKESTFTYKNKNLRLTDSTPAEKLLLLLVKKGFLEKSMIVKSLYQRPYQGESDDKLIYYHIHNVRKRLRSIGLPAEAISNEDNGYRLVPEVQIVEEDN